MVNPVEGAVPSAGKEETVGKLQDLFYNVRFCVSEKGRQYGFEYIEYVLRKESSTTKTERTDATTGTETTRL
jgi:hypothetical protein